MTAHQHQQEKSRLGRLLVSRGYLSESQLQQGLAIQRETGQRLGEALVQCGWISERELHRVLRHQARYRHALAFMAMVSLPLQPLVTMASPQVATPPRNADSGLEYQQGRGLQALSDLEMAEHSGQGGSEFLTTVAELRTLASNGGNDQGETDALDGLRFVATTFIPVLAFLDAEVSLDGVHYASGQPRFELQPDGGLKLALPERIDAIRMADLRVSAGGASLGSVSLHDVRFHPQSSMTIHVR